MNKSFLSLGFVGIAMLGCRSLKPAPDHLNEFAMERGVDLYAKLGSICAGNTNALAGVFRFSLSFTNLNDNARSYGKLVYGIYRTLANMGVGDRYAAVLGVQDSPVQQRVRDFLYYSLVHELPKERTAYRESWSTDGSIHNPPAPQNGGAWTDKEIRENFTSLFPADFQFGHDNPIFKQQP